MSNISLSDGTTIPWVAWGNGTGQAKKDAIESGKIALESGVRHIDTAQLYKNEEQTGLAIEKSGIPRSEVYVTSKIGRGNFADTAIPLDEVRKAVEGSLERLGTVPDLYLIHNPFVPKAGQLREFWSIFEDLKDEGKLKSIGVSNFRPQDIEVVVSEGVRHKPVINQIEFHPYVLAHLEPLLAIQEKHGIAIASYGALTPLLRHPTGGPLKPVLHSISGKLSKKYNDDIDPNTVLLLYLKAKGVVAVTASGNAERIKGLGKLYLSNWELEKEDVEEIERVGKTIHFRHYTEHMETDFPLPDLPSE